MTIIYVVLGAAFIAFFVYVARLPLPSPTSADYAAQAWRCESYIEERLLLALARRGHPVIPQHPVGHYRLDLAFPSVRLAIECDGKAYHSTPEQRARDRRRDAYLRRKGWRVLRFSGRRINGDLAGVVTQIESALKDVL